MYVSLPENSTTSGADNSHGLLRQRAFEFTPNAQAWPRSLNSAIGGDSNSVYLVVNDLGTPSGEGLDFINGQTWLERFYAVLDTGGNQVGIAETPYTYAIIE